MHTTTTVGRGLCYGMRQVSGHLWLAITPIADLSLYVMNEESTRLLYPLSLAAAKLDRDNENNARNAPDSVFQST